MQLGEDTTTMSMTLNPVNEAAFQKAVQSLETLNRAAVFHPTGTGKSCIAWKVVEAHPQTTFFWLVAGAQRLALRQAELTRYNGGTLPGNVRFCDCEKLAAATPEQWVRLGEQKPGCIVLDCYHELSAVCWAQSVQKLLRMCPQAKVLGLGVPNGAPVCAAAQELFADCIVSHMTVAEAMAAGTMPVPSAYAALLWPQEEELATLRARIKNLCMPKGDTSLRVQYEELSWSLRQVENLTVLLPRLLSDTSGHYLVLFESAAYQEKLGTVWEKYDPWQERYDLALAYKTEHGDLEIPSVYKTADGVWLGSWVSRQRQALNSGSSALSSERRKLLRTLFKGERRPSDPAADHGTVREANWERNFRSAARYARKYKHLLVPASYVDSDGVRLGVWISNLRAARKNRPDSYQVTPAHIKKLNSIGMVWDARDAKWGTAYQQAKAYYKAHGNLHAAANYKSDETGFCLGDWLRRMREWDTTHDPKLTPERRAMLDKIGMEWSE